MLLEDVVKLVFIIVLETFVLSRQNATNVRIEYIRWVDDLDYFNSYP